MKDKTNQRYQLLLLSISREHSVGIQLKAAMHEYITGEESEQAVKKNVVIGETTVIRRRDGGMSLLGEQPKTLNRIFEGKNINKAFGSSRWLGRTSEDFNSYLRSSEASSAFGLLGCFTLCEEPPEDGGEMVEPLQENKESEGVSNQTTSYAKELGSFSTDTEDEMEEDSHSKTEQDSYPENRGGYKH
ncbi:hypothetical protein M9H77_27414 [Catharanthus roseus]|uniref:Uncharacterized protein n=1 Tax=Catharanthus roseus TaxID=4058 RepID=A0ACC0AGK1_CATRO|nr:hypothetical protein M9H77_27414 [Catharanthus roseus]